MNCEYITVWCQKVQWEQKTDADLRAFN